MSDPTDSTNIRHVTGNRAESGVRQYARLTVGRPSIPKLLAHEVVTTPLAGLHGGGGILLRRLFYRMILGSLGRGVAIGRDVVIRGAGHIRLGNRALVDDLCVLDARGEKGEISIADDVVLSRGTVIRARNAPVRIEQGADIGCYCILATDSRLEVGREVLVGAFSYLCAGGLHRIEGSETSILSQGMDPSRGIRVDDGAWIGTHATVLDGVTVGKGAVIGANALVNRSVPDMSVAYGSPAEVRRKRGEG